MSILSNGDEPRGKEPDPKRRRTRRPGNRTKRDEHSAQNAESTTAADAKRDSRGSTNGAVPDDKNGSRTPTRNGRDGITSSRKNRSRNAKVSDISVPQAKSLADNAVDASQDELKPKRSRFGKRRRRKRGNHIQPVPANGEIRNVRSMPKRTTDAKYNPADDTQAVDRPKPHHHNSRNNNQHSGGVRAYQRKGAPLYAALDLGTNNCRLLIAMPQDKGRFRVMDGFSRIVRLGEGLEQSGKLSDAAMDRAVEALKICARKLSQKKIRKQRLIATEACRQALNGEAFLERVKSETGLDLEIVNRETEARLAAEGCGSLMDKKADGAVLFDIGGGSSELILVDSSDTEQNKRLKIADKIVSWTSLPMGVVTLAERFGGRDVSRELFGEMVQDVTKHIEAFEGRHALAEAFKSGHVHLLGTSGTVTTLAGIHLELPRYDRRRVDGIWLQDLEVDTVINRLLDMSFTERAQNPCIGEERADLVLAGCAILNAIRLFWPTPRLRVADRGLREGLLAEMMNSDQVWMKRHRDRRHYGRRNTARQKPDSREEKS